MFIIGILLNFKDKGEGLCRRHLPDLKYIFALNNLKKRGSIYYTYIEW